MPSKTASRPTAAKAAQSAALALNLDDVKRLELALALAAADEIEENSRFANRVRTTYEMLPETKPRGANGSMPKALTVTLVPIKRVEGGEINPSAPMNPYLLLEVYGAHQLRDALDLYSPAKVREGAVAVAEQQSDKKPAAKTSKAKLIEYIVSQLAPEA